MKDEIKEILDKLNKNKNEIKTYCYYPDDVLSCDDLIKLLDYITNLQKENERINQYLDSYRELVINQNKTLEDYKSRNKKAIKYNYELQERYCHSALFDDLVASKIYEITEKQLNILQGEDKDVKD